MSIGHPRLRAWVCPGASVTGNSFAANDSVWLPPPDNGLADPVPLISTLLLLSTAGPLLVTRTHITPWGWPSEYKSVGVTSAWSPPPGCGGAAVGCGDTCGPGCGSGWATSPTWMVTTADLAQPVPSTISS